MASAGAGVPGEPEIESAADNRDRDGIEQRPNDLEHLAVFKSWINTECFEQNWYCPKPSSARI